jgi:hypothetical protein
MAGGSILLPGVSASATLAFQLRNPEHANLGARRGTISDSRPFKGREKQSSYKTRCGANDCLGMRGGRIQLTRGAG